MQDGGCCQAGPQLGPSWAQAGPELGPSRAQAGPKPGPSWGQAEPKLGPSQISGNLEIWDLEIWKFEIQQNPKNQNSQNPNPFCPKCGKVWVSRKKSSWPHLGPPGPILCVGRKNPKNTKKYLFSLVATKSTRIMPMSHDATLEKWAH